MQPEAAKYLFDVQRAAALNILVHGYATVDDKIVWGVVETSLPSLIESVDTLLGKA